MCLKKKAMLLVTSMLTCAPAPAPLAAAGTWHHPTRKSKPYNYPEAGWPGG
jgi:hypothetical protein